MQTSVAQNFVVFSGEWNEIYEIYLLDILSCRFFVIPNFKWSSTGWLRFVVKVLIASKC